MAKTKIKPQSKKLQENKKLNNPHYVITISAQSYSNIAAVLAGFAFTAVILAIQTTLPPALDNIILKDWATIAFLLSFIGCIFSAFVFAMVTGENKLYPRSYAMALFGGTGFSISTNLVVFGLALLAKIFLSPKVYSFAQSIFPVIMFFSILFVATSALDPILTFDKKSITKEGLAHLMIPSIAPLVIVWGIFQLFGIFISDTTFYIAMYGAFAIILLSAIGSLAIASFPKPYFRFSLLASGAMVGIHSIVIGLFLVIL